MTKKTVARKKRGVERKFFKFFLRKFSRLTRRRLLQPTFFKSRWNNKLSGDKRRGSARRRKIFLEFF
jgi:hypothetical protein